VFEEKNNFQKQKFQSRNWEIENKALKKKRIKKKKKWELKRRGMKEVTRKEDLETEKQDLRVWRTKTSEKWEKKLHTFWTVGSWSKKRWGSKYRNIRGEWERKKEETQVLVRNFSAKFRAVWAVQWKCKNRITGCPKRQVRTSVGFVNLTWFFMRMIFVRYPVFTGKSSFFIL